jgi:hypothetical protein
VRWSCPTDGAANVGDDAVTVGAAGVGREEPPDAQPAARDTTRTASATVGTTCILTLPCRSCVISRSGQARRYDGAM